VLEIIWPDGGTRQKVFSLPLDRAVEITEGQKYIRVLEWAPVSSAGQK
jgi:hypothetical protein